MNNPFEFKNPDTISSYDVIDLFVPVFGEYYNVPVSGHTFINGARGSGKSMMFRFMTPDCQILVDSNGNKLDHPRGIVDLDYFGIYIPIKKGHLDKMDIRLNDKHGIALLTEHFMVAHFSLTVFKELSEIESFKQDDVTKAALVNFYNKSFINSLIFSGYRDDLKSLPEGTSFREIFETIISVLKNILRSFQHEYLTKLIGLDQPLPYNGPILLYSEFLYELLNDFRKLPFMPLKPIYLLIDDADEMSILQRKVLNSWVSLRTTAEVSLKISTQLKYKVYTTINDSRIDTPHDYSEVNLNDIYTSKRDLYYQRVKEIVSKRLSKYNFQTSDPEQFYPEDQDQKSKLSKKWDSYEEQQINNGQTKEQAYSYAHRYVVPDFIKELEGNRYTYSYAGFNQLVNISSGIIREFINFSSEMYISQHSINGDMPVTKIDNTIQDREIKKYSENKIDTEFDKYREEASDKSKMDKLRNLIHGMGGLFNLILLSKASERRVFSVALNDEPDDELRDILDLGIQHGYLQKSMIGNKHGTGKSRLYILTRVLAPHFKLDPTSFAGYKFMDSEILKRALSDPRRFIEAFKKSIKGAGDEEQNLLFNDED